MLSPKRATRRWCASRQAQAARAQAPIRPATTGSSQWPTTVLRAVRIRVSMNPNSRSPWAAWLRFMKSMSISPHGRSRLNWVWRWSRGLRRACRPAIHMRAGENVCIQRMTPTQASAALASRRVAAMLSDDVTTGRWTTRTGIASWPSSEVATRREFSATCRSVSSPYISWLPVTNQTSSSASGFIVSRSHSPWRRRRVRYLSVMSMAWLTKFFCCLLSTLTRM